MKKEHIQIILIAICILALFFILKGRGTSTVPATKTTPEVTSAVEEIELETEAEEEVFYTATSSRDPLVMSKKVRDKLYGRVQKDVTELTGLTVTGISFGDKPLAVINNRVVREGDTINGAKILEITRDSVRVLSGDMELTLKVER